MSTYLLAKLDEAKTATPKAAKPPTDTDVTGRIQAYLSTLAAMVPGEVLLLHALVVTYARNAFTEAQKASPTGGVFLKADESWLALALVAGMVLPVIIYVISKGLSTMNTMRDWALACIPGGAFLCWTMLQPVTVFDAVAGDLPNVGRVGIGFVLAAILTAWHAKLEQAPP